MNRLSAFLLSMLTVFTLACENRAVERTPAGIVNFSAVGTLASPKELSGIKKQQIDADIDSIVNNGGMKWGLRQLVEASAKITAKNLSYNFQCLLNPENCRGKPYFEFPAGEKNTNCVDYSYLYCEVFNQLAPRIGLPEYSASRVHGNVSLFGKRMTPHQWVRITGGSYVSEVDPVLYDYTGQLYVSEN